ncbi:MAG TPA: c-type cytochrome [Casimicrobiaceae bacterium]
MTATRLFVLLAGAAALATAFSAAADDQMKLATDKGCTACHAVDKKVIGPAYKEVAKKYKGDAKASEALAQKVIKGSQGVWGPIPMPPNKLSDEEAKKLVAWILAL